MRLPLAPEGRREQWLMTAAAVMAGAAAAAWSWPLVSVPVSLWLAGVYFFRDPQRTPPDDPHVLLAPADGTVTQIARLDQHEHIPVPALKIGIFLSLLDVHVNRMPCAGLVREVFYKKGRFYNAMSQRSSEANESNTVVLEPANGAPGPIVIRQIAGVLARRIVCTCRQGERLEAGQRFGMIKFGSRTELIVPLRDDVRVCVRTGQKVRAGRTILVRTGSPPGGTPWTS